MESNLYICIEPIKTYTMTQIETFYARQRELHTEVIEALQKAIGKRKINLEDLEQEFEDESFNTVVKVNRTTIFTDSEIGEYPITDLTINDALYILGVITK